jgi:hypothetical protein
LVLAGLRREGAWQSLDAGSSWNLAPGLGSASATSFGFARAFMVAGTDRGIFINRDGSGWIGAGLSGVGIAALAVAAINEPSRLVAGGTPGQAGDSLDLYQSADGALSWSPVQSAILNGSLVATIAAGPLQRETRPLLMGTSRGLFSSPDNGGSWTQLSGLPATDYNLVGFVQNHPERYYAGSDGGGSDRGGLWTTADSGQHFISLKAPVASVTGLAISNEEMPTLYVATFRPEDHAVLVWSYRDVLGPPRGPLASVPGPVLPARAGGDAPARVADWGVLLKGPEAPFLLLGLAGLVVLLGAVVAYLRRGRT